MICILRIVRIGEVGEWRGQTLLGVSMRSGCDFRRFDGSSQSERTERSESQHIKWYHSDDSSLSHVMIRNHGARRDAVIPRYI